MSPEDMKMLRLGDEIRNKRGESYTVVGGSYPEEGVRVVRRINIPFSEAEKWEVKYIADHEPDLYP